MLSIGGDTNVQGECQRLENRKCGLGNTYDSLKRKIVRCANTKCPLSNAIFSIEAKPRNTTQFSGSPRSTEKITARHHADAIDLD